MCTDAGDWRKPSRRPISPLEGEMPGKADIVDFACPSKKLVVEVDGTQHADSSVARTDLVRTRRLEALGWTILRVWNDDVLRDIDAVCAHIVASAGLTAADAARRAGGRRHEQETYP
ncbi:MAG: endonuclease domain-containing protein [Rhizobiaceae bacterium]